jgi:molybdopterin converting factor small subunit
MPEPIKVIVRYGKELYPVTGVDEDPVVMSTGATFFFLLQSVFEEHPMLLEKYQPGELALMLNGTRPDTDTVLADGDLVVIIASGANSQQFGQLSPFSPFL